jgi:hypothetical protein
MHLEAFLPHRTSARDLLENVALDLGARMCHLP